MLSTSAARYSNLTARALARGSRVTPSPFSSFFHNNGVISQLHDAACGEEKSLLTLSPGRGFHGASSAARTAAAAAAFATDHLSVRVLYVWLRLTHASYVFSPALCDDDGRRAEKHSFWFPLVVCVRYFFPLFSLLQLAHYY